MDMRALTGVVIHIRHLGCGHSPEYRRRCCEDLLLANPHRCHGQQTTCKGQRTPPNNMQRTNRRHATDNGCHATDDEWEGCCAALQHAVLTGSGCSMPCTAPVGCGCRIGGTGLNGRNNGFTCTPRSRNSMPYVARHAAARASPSPSWPFRRLCAPMARPAQRRPSWTAPDM